MSNSGFRLRPNLVLSPPKVHRNLPSRLTRCRANHNHDFALREESPMPDEEQSEDISRDERRQHDRARLIVDVHFEGGDATGVASMQDISVGGLYMSTQSAIPVGSTLTLRIPVGGGHVVVKGDVVYTNPNRGVGVRFHRLPDEVRELLERELPPESSR